MTGFASEEGHHGCVCVVDVGADERRRTPFAARRPTSKAAVILLDDDGNPAVRVIRLPANGRARPGT